MNPHVRLGPGATGLQWFRSASQPCNPLQLGIAVGQFLKLTMLPFSHLSKQDHEHLCPRVAVGLSEVPSEAWRARPGVSARCWNCCFTGPTPLSQVSVWAGLVTPASPVRVWRLLASMTQDWTEGQEPLLQWSSLWPAHFSHSGGSQRGSNAAAPRTTDRQTHAQRREEETGEDRRGRVPEGAPSLPGLPRPPGPRLRLCYSPLTPAAGRRDPHPSALHLKKTSWALLTFSISQQPRRKKLLPLSPGDRREPRLRQRPPREHPWKPSRRTPRGSAASPLRRSKEILP